MYTLDGIVNLLLFLPVSLPALFASEHYERLFERVWRTRQDSGSLGTVRLPLPSKLANRDKSTAAQSSLRDVLNETPSQCSAARPH